MKSTPAVVLMVALLAGCTATDEVLSPPASPVATSAESPSPAPSAAPSPVVSPSPTPPPVEFGTFDGARATALATELSTQIGIRRAGEPGDVAARDWFTSHMRAAGWTVDHEFFDLPQGGQSANIVAWIGEDPREMPHVVVGAHIDTRGESPGANDNATGTAAIIALAEELGDEAVDAALVFVAFGAEEFQPSTPREHHIGSDRYAQARSALVTTMLSIDMVGNGPRTCICYLRNHDRSFADRLHDIAHLEPIQDVYRTEARGQLSDHTGFALLGVPSAFLWTYDDGRLHTAADTAEYLQVRAVQSAGDLALAWIRRDVLESPAG